MKASLCTAVLLLLAAPNFLTAQGLEARVKALEEKVALLQAPPLAVYVNSGAVNVPNGNPEMDFLPLNKRVLDQRGIVTIGPPWRFAAPIAGTYRFDLEATLPNDNVATSPYFRCDILVVRGNATPVVARTNWAYDVDCKVSTILHLAKGDQVFTRVAQASGHQRTLSLAQFVGAFVAQ